jgi:hypothetical protein
MSRWGACPQWKSRAAGANLSDVLFHEVTVEPTGTVGARREHDTAELAEEAVDVFRSLLCGHSSDFRLAIPIKGVEHIELQWDYRRSAATARYFSGGALVIACALLTGADNEADLVALQMFAASLPPVTGRGGVDLAPELAERPLIVAAWSPDADVSRDDRVLINTMKTCLAAAFFDAEVDNATQGH